MKALYFTCILICLLSCKGPKKNSESGNKNQQFELNGADSLHRILVISGGTQKAAWGGGVAQTLINDFNRKYDIAIGTSGGNLITPFIVGNALDTLESLFSKINNNDVFSFNPIPGGRRYSKPNLRKYWKIYRRLKNRNCKSIGESENLLKTYRKNFTKEIYNSIQNNPNKEFISTVSNVTDGKVEYKSSLFPKYDYELMTKWIWVSTCIPLIMSSPEIVDPQQKDGLSRNYCDGGMLEGVPLAKGIQRACEKGYSYIDVIVLNDSCAEKQTPDQINGIMGYTSRVMDMVLAESRRNDIYEGEHPNLYLKAKEKNGEVITVDYYFMNAGEERIISNSYGFVGKELDSLWMTGKQRIHKELTTGIFTTLYTVRLDKNNVCKHIYPAWRNNLHHFN